MRRTSSCLLATIALSTACGLDGRAVGVSAQGGAGNGSGLGGTTDASLSGAGGQGPGAGGDMTGSLAGANGLAGEGGSGQGGSGQGGTDAGAGGSNPGGGGSPDAGPDVPPDPELPACAAQFLAGLGSASVSTTAAGAGQFTLSCGAGSSDDAGIYWVAPEAGYYSIDTFGSSFDTVLGVVSAECDGAELACNDDGGEAPHSELVRQFAAGEGVVLVVDGNSGGFGNAVVNTHAVTCPAIDTERQVLPLASTTLDGDSAHDGACGGDGQLEKTFRWKAPSSGLFRFTVSSDEMSPALYVERGPRCGGELLGCNAGGFGGPATVVRRLNEADLVTLIVEGTDAAGSFALNVEDISENACPDQPPPELFDGISESGVLLAGDPSVLTGSCAPARQRLLPGGEFDLPEHAYPVSVDAAFCNVGITADGPVAVYVLEGLTCGGRELFCQTFEAPDFEVLSPALDGGPSDYVVVVESLSPVTGDVSYTLDYLCALN
jgi:hypothetical protein